MYGSRAVSPFLRAALDMAPVACRVTHVAGGGVAGSDAGRKGVGA